MEIINENSKNGQLLKNRDEIRNWLDRYGVEKYHINYDVTVDVSGNVNINSRNLSHIQVQFGKVDGHFFCNKNKLTSLAGCPKEVGDDFFCENNLLTSLEFGPEKVGVDYRCSNNQLISLKHSPLEINGTFGCGDNELISLKFAPLKVSGDFYCYDNKLTNLENTPEISKGLFCKRNPFIDKEINNMDAYQVKEYINTSIKTEIPKQVEETNQPLVAQQPIKQRRLKL